ncbi:AAA family ATPase [Candidatus Roizmanbacteria bacterium]|nr:MAG: AAA family ATPase [Candidatus Roizmanbacteria bacterium]
MKLHKITIEDYRSVKKIPFTIEVRDDDSFTYGLIGINEAGKSSILKAIGLKDGLLDASGTKLPLSKDFRQKKDICVTYSYEITPADDQKLYELINNREENMCLEKPSETEIVENIPAESKKHEIVKPTYNSVSSDLIVNFRICFKTASSEPIFSITVIQNDQEVKISSTDEILSFFKDNVHKTIFWTAEDRYLISKPINIAQFIADTSISIPLRNCFLLASIKEEEINQSLSDALADTTDCEFLEETLANNVTEHIKSAWPNHPVKITFKIMDGHINFHVKDLDSKGKAQTSDMRSDGFKQFVSFLLTIAAENKNEELENTILLLDEPETHLHPKAQEYLLTQLIGITNNKKNNMMSCLQHTPIT